MEGLGGAIDKAQTHILRWVASLTSSGCLHGLFTLLGAEARGRCSDHWLASVLAETLESGLALDERCGLLEVVDPCF
jgi:hypothetical protein